MSVTKSHSSRQTPLDLFFFATHTVIALLASLVFEVVAHQPWPMRLGMAVVYLFLAYQIYRRIRARELERTVEDIQQWRRFALLQQSMLDVVAQFLKERYQVIHHLVSKLDALRASGSVSEETVIDALEEFDKARRAHIKRALEQVSAFLRSDGHLRPEDPEQAATDAFKVTFYAVERAGEDGTPSTTAEETLRPKYRAIPNEAEPQTRRFRRDEGASGRAWATKKTVVCEQGGKDRLFKDMWDGGGQKERYKSMICVPAIEDIPTERLSDVYGVLTVDSPVREGYFDAKLDQFWATLHQPICNLLIYCRETERLKDALVSSIQTLSAQSDGSSDRSISTSQN